MKESSLILQIYELIKSRQGEVIHSGEIERFGQSLGYKASHADRRCRDLTEKEKTVGGKVRPNPAYSPMIQKLTVNGCAAYRWKTEAEVRYTQVKVEDEVINVPSLF